MRRSGSGGEEPPDLGRARLVLQLDHPAVGARSAMVASRSTDMITPLLAGWSWTTTGMSTAAATAR